MQHLKTFMLASGMKINLDKCILILLGDWIDHPPQALLDSCCARQSVETPFDILGVTLGPSHAASLNWTKAMQKMRLTAAKLHTSTLALSGYILVANACITNISVYTASHNYIPYTDLVQLKTLINNFTTPNNKYISHDSKIKPHACGGPLTPLLDPLILCPTLNAKWIHYLTTKFPLDITIPSWAHDWIFTIYRYASKTFGLYFIDHILFADFEINTIMTGKWYDPMIINALKFYKRMGFTRHPDLSSYEDCASLPIWFNPLIKDPNNLAGDTFNNVLVASPFCVIKLRKLYFVGQLFTNWNPDSFLHHGGRVPQGRLKDNATLNREFSPVTPIPDCHWESLKDSVRRSTLFDPISRGVSPFVAGEFVSTLMNENGIDGAGDVYVVLPDARIQHYDRDDSNPHLLIPTQSINQPGLNEYPPLSDLFRIHTYDDRDKNTYAIGLKYKHMVGRSNFSWKGECFFGILQSEYSSCHRGSTFSDINKNFRKSCKTVSANTIAPHEPDPSFQELCDAHSDIDWHKKMQSIRNCRVDPKCKNTLWRVITNNLYLGDRAYRHLTYKDSHHPARYKFEFCPYCDVNTPCTVRHQIWECPCIKPVWDLFLTALTRANIHNPIHSFDDLFLYIDKGNLHTLTLIVRDQIIYNIVHAIWCEYSNLMRLIESLTHAEFSEHKMSLVSRLTDKINHLNYEAFITLPHHSLFITNLAKLQGRREGSSSGLAVRNHLIQPYLFYSLNSLDDSYITSYSNAWCKHSVFAQIVDYVPK